MEDPDLLEKFGALVKASRIASGLRQKDLATLSSTTQATISEIESGKGNVSILLALRLLDVLNLDIIDLSQPDYSVPADDGTNLPYTGESFENLQIGEADDVPALKNIKLRSRM